MGKLIRIINGELAIAENYVATPGYTLRVSDYAGGATPPYGWEYHPDTVTREDFALPWQAPTGASDAYALGAMVTYNNKRWRSLIVGNVWEPGVSGWADVATDIPLWLQPTGAQNAYAEGAVVRYSGHLWRSLVAANVGVPGVANWRKISLTAPREIAPPAWVQPTGSQDAYALNALVTHNGKVWRSRVAGNVGVPGVYAGWTVV